MGQAFGSALQAELAEYYRLLAVIEAQVQQTTGSLTLRRLIVWTHEPKQRLLWLALLADHVRGLKGGQRVAALAPYTRHGDPAVARLAASVLATTAAPLHAMLATWLREGTVRDPHGELFIAADYSVPVETTWARKFRLRQPMCPAHIPPALAARILLAGKTIDFLRTACRVSITTSSSFFFSSFRCG